MRLSLKLLKSKTFIFVLLTGFISASLSGAICGISLAKTEISLSEELNKIAKHSDNNVLNNFNIRNQTDDYEVPGISIFIVNIYNSKTMNMYLTK